MAYRSRSRGWRRRFRKRMRRIARRSRKAAWRTYYAMRRMGRIVSKPRKSPNKRKWTIKVWR